MSPLFVGAIFGDDKQWRGALGKALDHVAKALNDQRLDGATIQLVFVFSGELSRPDWKGLKIGRVGEGAMTISIAVPEGPVDDEQLLASAGEALNAASKRLKAAGVAIDEAQIDALLSSARAALGLDQVPIKGPSKPLPDVEDDPDTAMITVSIPLSAGDDRAADAEIARLQARELCLDAELRSQGLGEVDGNELGSREFTMFIVTPERHVRKVMDIVKADPSLPPGTKVED